MRFHIPDMTCGGCVRGVTQAIQSQDPKAEVLADLVTHTVTITTTAPRDRLVAALDEAGFTAS